MGARTGLGEWPLFRQVSGSDPLGRGSAVESPRPEAISPRTDAADEVVEPVCPSCAVGCGQNVYVRDGRVTQIEGDPDSPVSRGRVCPKGSASTSLVTSPSRVTTVRYRRPSGTQWEDLDLDTAVDMIADRVLDARRKGRQDTDGEEFFCEVSPALAAERGLEHLGWATPISARTAVEARMVVTERMKPLRIGTRRSTRSGFPTSGGATVSRPVTPRTTCWAS